MESIFRYRRRVSVSNVDTFCNVNGETYLCYYQLKMTSEVPDNYTITWYQQGDDPARTATWMQRAVI